jgi:hypothetical protein
MLNPCNIKAAFSWHPKAIQDADVSAVRSQTSPQHRLSIVLASRGTPTDGAHFEHAQNKRHHSAFL